MRVMKLGRGRAGGERGRGHRNGWLGLDWVAERLGHRNASLHLPLFKRACIRSNECEVTGGCRHGLEAVTYKGRLRGVVVRVNGLS